MAFFTLLLSLVSVTLANRPEVACGGWQDTGPTRHASLPLPMEGFDTRISAAWLGTSAAAVVPAATLVAQAPASRKTRDPSSVDSKLNGTSWRASLPASVQSSILWFADHEEGSLDDWEMGGGPDAGGGIFNTGGDDVEAAATNQHAHSGGFAARATIANAFQARNGKRAVRLMRWTNRPWTDGGGIFPSPAYFSTWMFIPEHYDPGKEPPWDPGDGGWWNIFQFKSDDAEGVSQPMFAVNLEVVKGELFPYLWESQAERSHSPKHPEAIPVRKWVHLEAFYKSSPTAEGRITIYQDGRKMIDVRDVRTVMPGGDETVVWGIGNYTDHIDGGAEPGTATLFFDDAAVSTARLLE